MTERDREQLQSWIKNGDRVERNQGAVKVACAIASRAGWKRKTYRGIITTMIRELQESLEIET